MAINYDPAAAGGAAFGNQDYEALKAKGHSDSEINAYIGGLDTTQVSNQYKERGGHTANDDSWKHNDDSYQGYIHSPAPASNPSHVAAKEKAINYDPTAHGGEAFGNLDYEHLKSQGNTDQEINKYLGTLDNSQVSNKYKERAGFIPNAKPASQGRLSSEGLYQDRYSVGKSGQNDKGEKYVSQGALGSINDYFGIKGNTQEEVRDSWNNFDFDKGYKSWTHTGRGDGGGHGGYAGDVLKLIDQNNFKVTDEQYNRVVNDAKNYNWDSKMASDGTQAGASHKDFDASGTYDARIGGTMQSQGNMNDVTGNSYGDWTNPEYFSNASVDARNTRKQAAENSNYESYKPEGYKYNPLSGDASKTALGTFDNTQNYGSNQSDFEVPGSNSDVNYDNWQEQIAKMSQNPYSKRSNASNMDLSFNPYRFQQGQ